MEHWLLRILVGEDDRVDGRPLYEWVVQAARKQHLAGATVLRGIMGFGGKSHLHTFKIERLSLDLPIVIEMVETRERLESFLREIQPRLTDGIATLERVELIRFGAVPPEKS
jgi:PII-like signaling protein